ncbi:hypothetical protein TRL7639_02032 [Falsiruegeria litorea R37]|uniref:Lysozyme inhibitor LprI N-terminal domain-containing protein n=1 Tax=Falsiruegeria litorea R37 TaxID=1200284 RepID=A0A1Y5SK90_9RHOB|nr:hypothetical protein [Falsiruegeria litorea]SLN39610.1 hypothetical protein TRL7639_02032 [Falsiruegeria litorea R37]
MFKGKHCARVAFLSAMVLSYSPFPAYATEELRKELETAIAQCNFDARTKILELADVVQDDSMDDLFGGSAMQCVNKWKSVEAVFYDPGIGAYVLAKDAEAILAAKRRLELQQKNKAREKELARRTVEACFELEQRDPTSAYLNPICHDFFRVKLPNWD